MCFFIHREHLCHFVTLWITSFFSHLPQQSYFSSLTFLVSLSCQFIFLSPCTPLSSISTFLISPNMTLFFSFSCRFFLCVCRTFRHWTIFCLSCFAVLHWLFFFLSVAFPVALSLFQLCTVRDTNKQRDRKLLQCQLWASVLLSQRSLCGLAWSVLSLPSEQHSETHSSNHPMLWKGSLHYANYHNLYTLSSPRIKVVTAALFVILQETVYLYQEPFLAKRHKSVFYI